MSSGRPSSWIRRIKDRFRHVDAIQAIYRHVHWHARLRFERAPWSVSLETNATCNRKCSYCPVSTNQRTGEMPRELFEKIIDDLVSIDFRRTLSFHFYNEPLLDERLPELVAHARSRLPHCIMDIFTNGDFLTPVWIDALLSSGIDVIRVSLHSPRSEKHVRRVLEQVDEEKRERIAFDSFFDREETGGFLYNRIQIVETADDAPRRSSRGPGCSLVNSMAINFEGKTALCCNDFYAANGHGSIATSTIGDLWRSSRPVRRRIYMGYFDKPICHVCNVGA